MDAGLTVKFSFRVNAGGKAFELAARYQRPVFILTDQFNADSYRAVAPFAVDELAPIEVGSDR